ncbi:MAG: DJ-1/PfpI family protein [Vicinamibacteria bacterium]
MPLAGMRVAIVIGDGSDESAIALVQKALRATGAQTVLVGHRPGPIATSGGTHRPEHTVLNSDAQSFDAVVVPGGDTEALTSEPRAVDFVGNACGLEKPVAAIGNGRAVVEASGSAGVGLVRGDDAQVMRVARELIMALAAGPQWARRQNALLSA